MIKFDSSGTFHSFNFLRMLVAYGGGGGEHGNSPQNNTPRVHPHNCCFCLDAFCGPTRGGWPRRLRATVTMKRNFSISPPHTNTLFLPVKMSIIVPARTMITLGQDFLGDCKSTKDAAGTHAARTPVTSTSCSNISMSQSSTPTHHR